MKGFIFPYTSRLVMKEKINYNVICFSVQKPFGFNFHPGQAVDLSIDKPGFELEVAPFTIISAENDSYLKFIIKIQPSKNSLTYHLSVLKLGAMIKLSRPWNTFEYMGPGNFIAAGTGIVPFIPILDYIRKFDANFTDRYILVYASKNKEGILFEKKLRRMFGKNFITKLSNTKSPERIDFVFLKSIIRKRNQYFYVCGPKSFEFDTMSNLVKLGIQRKRIQTGYNFEQIELVNS